MSRRSTIKKGNSEGSSGNISKRITLILAIITLILSVIVILLFDKRIQKLLFPQKNDSPVIERVPGGEDNPAQSLDDIPQIEDSAKNQDTDDATAEDDNKVSQKQNVARLFFIRVNDNGTISTKSTLRQIKYDQAPLTAAINALLNGPSAGDLSTDILSLIPEGAQLLGARVSDDKIAFLNFNESFRFNPLGIEGYKAQIEQVVFTATEFSTVNKVQFLVEGKVISYLGGEGVWVGSPLTRKDF